MTGPDAPVLLVGPPRSGTTLLRVMLCRHPECWILTETHLLDLWVPRHPGLRTGDRVAFAAYWEAFTATDPFRWLELDADAVAARVAARGHRHVDVLAAMLEEAAASRGVRVVGEKTPDHAHHVATLLDAFPDARVLWMLRDPVATVSSELALDRAWASDDPAEAARRWDGAVRALLPWQDDPRVLAVRFERLVRDPHATLREVCSHVELTWDEALLADEGGHDAYRHGPHDPWARLDPDAADRPRALDLRALEVVDAIVGTTARAVGYPRPVDHVRGRERIHVVLHRAARGLRRLVPAPTGRPR